jgi:HEAT repeat protein
MKHLFIVLLLLANTAFGQEDKLIAILKSAAPTKEKADACRALAYVGTRQAVSALAPLLSDEQLSHMARYALEPIADPSVDAALRNALGTVKGRSLTGVIISLGVRKDRQAIEPLATFLNGVDPAVAQAASRALGSIGAAAVPALENALSSSAAVTQLAVCEGLFRCAETMSGAEATAVYDKVGRLPNLPHQVRVAALRGAIRSRGADGCPLLAEAIRTESSVPATDAIRISMEMPGSEVTKVLTGGLEQASEEKQVLLIQALGNRGDATAVPPLVLVARRGSAKTRIAAIRSLGQLGDRSSVPVLTVLVKDSEEAVSNAAQIGLFAFPGEEADTAVLGLLHQSDATIRVAGIEGVSQRRMTPALPVLMRLAGDTDAAVASASFKALGELAGVPEIPGIVDVMLKTKAVSAAEPALSAICARQGDATVCSDKLLPGLARAQGEPELALLRVLGTVGGPRALAAMRAAAAQSDASVKETAVRTLCDWPSVDALPDLAQITKTTADPRFKILALRGQLRLIPMQTADNAQKLSQLQEILPLLENAEEKRLALAILGDIPSADSLALVMPHLSSEGLKEEASVAAVAIGEKIVSSHPAEVAEAMKRVQTNNNQLAGRARQLLARSTSRL